MLRSLCVSLCLAFAALTALGHADDTDSLEPSALTSSMGSPALPDSELPESELPDSALSDSALSAPELSAPELSGSAPNSSATADRDKDKDKDKDRDTEAEPASTSPTAPADDAATAKASIAAAAPDSEPEAAADTPAADPVTATVTDAITGAITPEAGPALEVLTALTKKAAKPVEPAVAESAAASDATAARLLSADAADAAAAAALETDKDAADAEPLKMLGITVQPGTMKRATWNATEAFSGTNIPTPVLIAHGAQEGPLMCLTAAVHGDELNGIETVRRIMHQLKPELLTGTIVGVPIVNLQGFQRHSRYLPDRRDLNRYFPGHPRGSSASRIAYAFFNEVIQRCDGLVDLHTGSFHRTNLPQIRADLNNESVVRLTEGFGSTIILHSEGGVGTLRRASVEAGIPAVTLEAGEPLRLQDDEVKHSVRGIYTLLETLGMYNKRGIRGNPEPIYFTSEWVRANSGGILFSAVKLGKRIRPDELLGTVTDPISNEREEIRSPFSGRVIGMALNQFVMPGFATYHIGIEAEDAAEAKTDEDPIVLSHDVAYEPDMDVVEQ